MQTDNLLSDLFFSYVSTQMISIRGAILISIVTQVQTYHSINVLGPEVIRASKSV